MCEMTVGGSSHTRTAEGGQEEEEEEVDCCFCQDAIENPSRMLKRRRRGRRRRRRFLRFGTQDSNFFVKKRGGGRGRQTPSSWTKKLCYTEKDAMAGRHNSSHRVWDVCVLKPSYTMIKRNFWIVLPRHMSCSFRRTATNHPVPKKVNKLQKIKHFSICQKETRPRNKIRHQLCRRRCSHHQSHGEFRTNSSGITALFFAIVSHLRLWSPFLFSGLEG